MTQAALDSAPAAAPARAAPGQRAQRVLAAEAVSVSFGGVHALDGASVSLAPGRITGLVGPNGAGKSTLFNVLAGTQRPRRGTVRLAGADITRMPVHRRAHAGIARTFQLARELDSLSVLENLLLAAPRQPGERLGNLLLRRGAVRRAEAAAIERALALLARVRLTRLADQPAGALSGGQKKLLELGRVMMARPRVVLLDEIAAGVNRTLLNDLAAVVERLNREERLTFFVIEHDMDLIGRLCDPVIVMAAGSVMVQGPMSEIRANPEVVEAYFGGGMPANRPSSQTEAR